MDKKNVLITLGIIGLILIPIVIYGKATREKSAPGNIDGFAQCLSDKGAKFYGAFWCSHCASQKKMFGDSFEKVNYIECSTPDGNSQLKECEEAGISGYPTWKFADDTRIEGEVTLEALSQKTGCELTK